MKIQRLEEATGVPEFREYSPEEIKQAYALAKAAFTADDLQQYTELDEGIPFEAVIAELEHFQWQSNQINP